MGLEGMQQYGRPELLRQSLLMQTHDKLRPQEGAALCPHQDQELGGTFVYNGRWEEVVEGCHHLQAERAGGNRRGQLWDPTVPGTALANSPRG